MWPGAVHFPDFLDLKGQKWWLDMVKDFHEKVPFDGLWVDMNEASNFCTGHVCEMPPDGLLDFVDKRESRCSARMLSKLAHNVASVLLCDQSVP